MKPNKEQLLKINETFSFILNFCKAFEECNEDLIFSDERIKEILEEEVEIDDDLEIVFPGEQDPISIPIDYFLHIADEIQSIKIINKSYIKTNLHSYYVVAATDSEDDYTISEFPYTQIRAKEGIIIDMESQSFIIGLAAAHLGEYDDDYWGTISHYQCIQFIYENKDAVLDLDAEIELLNAYIFEIADSTNIALNRSEIKLPPEYYFADDERETHKLRELEPYNEGMRLFTSAVQIKDEELKFLNFYKVLEHFAPIAVNIEANELMRKKLDSPKRLFENGDFIRSIFELANSTRDRFNDEDLIKASFSACVDIVGLFEILPESIQKKIKKHLGITSLNHSNDKQAISSASNIAAKIIYKTRNKVVHAKSNFSLTGEEIFGEEFSQLNEFMKQASSQAIRWYSRQPNHLKCK